MPQFSVKKPLTIFVVAIAILVLGVVAYTRMTPDLLPNMDFPYVIIMTTDPGAGPEKVESEVTRPIEQAMATLEGIVTVNSNSADNYSLVTLEFEEGTNLDTVGVDIQQKISALQGSWPETIGTPVILKINPSMLPVAMAAVSMEGMDIIELSEFVDDTLMGRLEGVSGVARVSVSGSVKEQLHVVISQEKVDVLNEKVAKGINKKLDAAVAALKAAKNQINGALGNMGDISDSDLLTELLPDTSELDKQILAKKAEIASIEATLTALEKIQSALAPEDSGNAKEIAALKNKRNELNARINKLNEQIAVIDSRIFEENEKIRKAQDALTAHGESAPEGADPDAWAADKAELESILTAVTADAQAAIASLNTERSVLAEERSSAYSEKAEVEERLNKLKPDGLTREEAQKQLEALGLDIDIALLDAQIASHKSTLTVLNAEVEALNAEKQAMYPDLGNMMGTLVNGMMQMSSAMSQIDSGLSTIESSRKDALAQADLDNILSLETISQILYAQNFAMPAGYVKQDGINYMVSVGDNFSSVEELENLMLFDFGLEDMEPIYLSDVADIFVTDNSETMYTRLGTEPGIMLNFEKQSNYATAEVSEGIKERFAELEAEHEGLEFFLLMDQGDYIMYIVKSILESLLFGALFSVLVLFIFLKDVRPTLITLLSIPLSLLFAIVLMYFSGITLNIISLSGLSISVGMLVDNSIVVIENIYRLRSKGANTIQAAVSGAKQVAGAITSSTLTTVCVFLPIVFVDGLTKQLFLDMALTMGYALMASLIVALTLVPAMGSKLLKSDKPLKKDLLAGVYGKYTPAVAWALDHKAIVLGVAVALLIGSAALSISKGFTFMPEMDSNTVSVTLRFDEETTMEEAVAISDEALRRVSTIEVIDTAGATMSTDETISVSMYVVLPEGEPGSVVADEIKELCKDLDCEISASSAMMDTSMLTGGSGVSMSIYSNDMEDLQSAAITLGELLEGMDSIDEVSNGLEDATTAIHVNIDRNKAMAKGFTTAQIYMQIATSLTTSSTATSFNLKGTEIDVIVETPEEKNVTLDSLLSQKFTQAGMMGGEATEFTLADVATIEETTGLSSINRENQQRYLTVRGSLAKGENVTLVTADVRNAVEKLTLPDSVKVEFGGENEMIMDAMFQLLLMLLLGMMLVYFVMVAQFQSLKSPFIIMFTIPLAFTGGFLGLLLTGFEISIISMIGFVMLVGIIVNNGIVLVEYINQLRAEGMERREAILEAGVTRIRPILMTTLTTILGLLMMAAGGDIGTALVQPMAIVCIGGLLYATIMTLFVIPVVYDIVCKNEPDIVSDDDLVILDI